MSSADDAWAVVQPALVELQENPDQPWETQVELLRDRLRQADPWVAYALVEWLEGLPDGERAELLVSDRLPELAYQVLTDQAPADEYAEGTAEDAPDGYAEGAAEDAAGGYDEGVWQAYLAENGPSWDGTDESWGAFREWFLYYAAERGVEEPATGLLTHMDGLSAGERVALFVQYGVTIGAPAVEEAHEPEEPAPVTAEQGALAEQIATQVPGIEQLSEEELASILAEVASETGR
jgi:hypothetical protein